MNVIGKIFGSDKIIDNLSKGADKVFFTKEEKAESWINTLKAYEPFKIAQRLLALMITFTYLFGWILSMAFFVSSYWFDDAMKVATMIADYNNSTLNLTFSIIVGFYFAGGAAEGVLNRFKKK